MPAFYLTLIAVLLAGIGARDQVTIGALTRMQGTRPGVLIVACLSALLTAAFAGWAASVMLAELPPPARAIFAAIAMGMAGLESLILSPRRDPREPTQSLGALLLVLSMHQVTDAARFLIFGMGVGFAAPIPAALAGGVGGCVLVAAAWVWPDVLASRAARLGRRIVGAILTIVALGMFLSEIGLL